MIVILCLWMNSICGMSKSEKNNQEYQNPHMGSKLPQTGAQSCPDWGKFETDHFFCWYIFLKVSVQNFWKPASMKSNFRHTHFASRFLTRKLNCADIDVQIYKQYKVAPVYGIWFQGGYPYFQNDWVCISLSPVCTHCTSNAQHTHDNLIHVPFPHCPSSPIISIG